MRHLFLKSDQRTMVVAGTTDIAGAPPGVAGATPGMAGGISPRVAGMPPGVAAGPLGAAGTPPGARRDSSCLGASSDTAGLLCPWTHAEPRWNTPRCSSADRGRRASRRRRPRRKAGTQRTGTSSRALEHWTSAPLSGDTSHLRRHAAGGEGPGRPPSLLPLGLRFVGQPRFTRFQQQSQLYLSRA